MPAKPGQLNIARRSARSTLLFRCLEPIDAVGVWYPVMASFGAIGGISMLLVMRKQRQMHASGDARVVVR